MSRWRVLVVAALVSTPILVWTALGWYYLWTIGWGFWAWCGCLAPA